MSTAPTFMVHAPCAQVFPDTMFPEPSDRAGIADAKKVCARCEFRAECLKWALSPNARISDGVVGGTSARERRKMSGKGRALAYDVGPLPKSSARHTPAA